ncbi:EFR1 family ferrodoxin, partial [Myxococcota bacterium]|nr:EFR1 family ferrodoxin [Myxococcota bacterium]
MTAVCYWFSGTGNSLFVARKITEVFPQMQRVPITKALVENPPRIHGDVVGFVFPVYAYGPPAIVKRFIARAAKGEVGFLFTAVTHGGGPAAALTMVERLLTENNLPLHSAFSIRMPSNYVVGSNPVTGEKAAAIFAQGEKETTRMCELLAQRAHVPVVSAATGGRLKSWAVHPLFMRGLKTADRKFFSRDSCTGCGICVKVCPMENIT